MAARERERIEDDQEIIAGGHRTQYSVPFPSFIGAMPFNFERAFDFRCCVKPTSWSFEVSFQREVSDGRVSCPVVIRRTDQSPGLVDVQFWMKVFSDPLIDLQPVIFRVIGIPHSHQGQHIFKNFISSKKASQLSPDRKALVQVSLAVYGCHEEKDINGRRKKTEKSSNTKALFAKI